MRGRACLLPAPLVHGIGYLVGGEAINLLLNLLSFIVVARLFTTTDYGSRATILDGVSILAAIAAFGLPLAAVQAVAGPDGDRFVALALLLRIASNGLAALVVLMAIAVSPERSTFGLAALFAAPGMIASGLGAACEEILRARQQFRRAATLENLARATQVAAIVVIAAVYRAGGVPRPGAGRHWWRRGQPRGQLRPSRASSGPTGRPIENGRHTAPAAPIRTGDAGSGSRHAGYANALLRRSRAVGRTADERRCRTICRGNAAVCGSAGDTAVGGCSVVPLPAARAATRRERPAWPCRSALPACGMLVDGVMVFMAPLAVRLTAGSAYSGSYAPARVLAGFIAAAYLSSVLTILLVEGQRPRVAAAAYVVELALVGRFGQDVCLAAGGGALVVSCGELSAPDADDVGGRAWGQDGLAGSDAQ